MPANRENATRDSPNAIPDATNTSLVPPIPPARGRTSSLRTLLVGHVQDEQCTVPQRAEEVRPCST
eukprot:6075836-Prymnesium_polylepis.1